MTKEIRNPNLKSDQSAANSDFVIRRSFVIWHSSFVIVLGLVLLWSCCAAPAFASPAWTPRFAVDPPWTTEKGLPQNSVVSLLQTRDGYLWVGTGYGLARFDGIHFKTFDDTDAPGLNSGKIVRLFEDSRGNLWIGTESAGILVADREGKIAKLKEAGQGDEGKLVDICEDPSGSIWISTALGRVFRYREGRLGSLEINNCNGLMADTSGHTLIGARERAQLTRLIGLGPILPGAPPALIFAFEVRLETLDGLLAGKSGGYWRLANGHIMKCQLDRVERDYGSYPWNARIAPGALVEDETGNLIIGTYGEGVHWLSRDGKFFHLTGEHGLLNPYVYSLCMDREGSLWVGTDGGGLSRVKQQVFDVIPKSYGSAIQSVCEDQKGGLWFGINNGGAGYWKNGELREYKATNVLSDLYVRSVLVDRAGNVWVGTAEGGLFKLTESGFKQIEAWPEISAIYQDRQGLLWFGTGRGLFCREPKRGYNTSNGLSADAVQALADDAAGNLWIGTSSGLNLLHGDRLTSFHKSKDGLPSDDISALYVDAENILWVATPNGLARYDGVKWTRYSREDGLISNHLGYLAEDAEHYLWIGSNAGLIRVSKKELNDFANGTTRSVACRAYGVDDGLPTVECSAGSQPAACVGRDGTLWFPTIKGLASVRPTQIQPNTNQPPVRIESVRVQGRLQSTNSLRTPPPQAVVIPANEEGLEIDYTSLNLFAPERARFKYRMQLDGHRAETNWIDIGNVRVAQYPTLPPGQHLFQVTACNEDGIWNETGASLAVTVLPPFWRTPWFVTIATLCLLGIIVGSVHYVSTQRLQRQLATLRQQEALERERARIARDLHDQLGANLTQVALLGEMVESDKELPDEVEAHARQISSTARETTRSLDEIVWTVNPSNDTLDGLINYVCKYAQEYFALAGLRYRLEVPSDLPATPITPELRHNVFLAAKEAVNNVVKHARASSAWLRLSLEPHRFTLEIEDDGRGIAAGDDRKGRNGLRNMRKRMEDVGGEFEAVPGTERGTRIRLKAPLQDPGGGSTAVTSA